MRIINGKRFYKADIDKAVRIDSNGWDNYDGNNYQWYTLLYEPKTGYVELDGNNSGSCYGDYKTRYFDSPESFLRWCNMCERDWGQLLGEINEDNAIVMDFIDKIQGDYITI
jgi:hypothetical protein